MLSCGVCPSGCPSVTFVSCVKMNNHILKKISPSDSPTILVFFVPNVMAIFRREPPPLTNIKLSDRWLVECLNNFDHGLVYSTKRRCPFIAQNATNQWIVFMSCRSSRSSFANEAVYAVCIYQFSTLTLTWHAYRSAQTDTDRDWNSFVIEPQAAGGYR